MKKRLFAAATFAVAACLAGCATTPPPAAKAPAMADAGKLVDAKRITLYTYDSDKPNTGKSSCYGVCATNWPPFMVASGGAPNGDYTIVKRDDGGAQWAYKGWPLYYWPEDQDPGDVYGDNYQNVWHIVKP